MIKKLVRKKMLKLDNKELDSNNYEIEIRKAHGSAVEYNKELKKIIQTDKWEELAFYIDFSFLKLLFQKM